MKRWFLLVSAVEMLMVSCNGFLLEENCVEPPFVPYVRGSLYAAAVKYPPGYDFRRDSLGFAAEICFFRDSSLMFSIPCSKGGIGIDADMHRIRGNHLYSDFNGEDGSTHIALDGKEIFSYEGDEMILDLREDGDDVFTLGISRSSSGWSLRRSGKFVCGRGSGHPIGGLYYDGNQLCFSYSIPDPSSSDRRGDCFYFVSDGVDSLVSIDGSLGQVRDIRRFNGELNMLGDNGVCAVWSSGGRRHILDIDGSSGVEDCRFIVADGKLMAAVTYILGESKRTAFWEYGSWKRLISTELQSLFRVCSICNETPQLCFAESIGGGAELGRIHYSSSVWHIGHSLLFSPFALCCDRKSFAVGINDIKNGLQPMVLRGRDTTSYDFNGYFIHLALP